MQRFWIFRVQSNWCVFKIMIHEKKKEKREREEVFHKINILNNPQIPRTMYIVRKRVIISAEWGNH